LPDTIATILPTGKSEVAFIVEIALASTRLTQYFTSFGWRYFFSVGFFYWGKQHMSFTEESLPVMS
jgi:hypothetical protein